MQMILFEEKDLLEIIRNTLEKFDSTDLQSDAGREAVARKVLEGVRAESERIEGKEFISSHEN